MATHKQILLAGRIYTHSRQETGFPNNTLDTADTKSSTPPQERMTSNTTSAENYNLPCRMLETERGRKYCRERCSLYENCLRGGE